MRSYPRRAPALRSILALAMLGAGLSACGTPRAIYLNAGPCSELVPKEWLKGVPSAPLPTSDGAGQWVAFGDAQTAQLDKANGRTVDSHWIIQQCEKREAEAVERISRRWWKV